MSMLSLNSLFKILLYSILILGAARLVLDSLKSYKRQVFHHYEENCNVFEGKWEWDNVSYPLYEEESCPYLGEQTTCQQNGRPDSFYRNWRWQPNRCNIPRFDPLKLLHMLRNKRMMFIGDSLQRGQFESMICLVQSIIPEGKKSFQTIPPMMIFKAKEFNASIEYYWAPFIVESISDDPTNHTIFKRLVHLDSITNHGKHWQGVDILLFESYVWWMFNPSFINATYGSPHKVQEYNATTAYKLALKTWAHWLESNIQPLTQKVFFMSMSPLHMWSFEWKPGSDGNCYKESYPIQGPYWGIASNLEIMKILHDALQELKIDVTLLNITQLSEYRKDAHTSVYGKRNRHVTEEQRANLKALADCMHWCLPGVPDAWNEILYAYLLKNYQNFSKHGKLP